MKKIFLLVAAWGAIVNANVPESSRSSCPEKMPTWCQIDPAVSVEDDGVGCCRITVSGERLSPDKLCALAARAAAAWHRDHKDSGVYREESSPLPRRGKLVWTIYYCSGSCAF